MTLLSNCTENCKQPHFWIWHSSPVSSASEGFVITPGFPLIPSFNFQSSSKKISCKILHLLTIVCDSNRSCTRNACCLFLFLKLRSHPIKACQLEGQWHPASALRKRWWLSHRHSNHLWILLSCRKGSAVVVSYNSSPYSLSMLFVRWFLYILFFLPLLHKFKLNLSSFSARCRLGTVWRRYLCSHIGDLSFVPHHSTLYWPRHMGSSFL